MPIFGVPGTLLILSGISLNAVACALLLQPVMWHAKKVSKDTIDHEDSLLMKKFDDENSVKRDRIIEKRLSKFGSQYLYYDDEGKGAIGIDVITPGTPMMSRSNDGW